jgi:hypothetical protein
MDAASRQRSRMMGMSDQNHFEPKLDMWDRPIIPMLLVIAMLGTGFLAACFIMLPW